MRYSANIDDQTDLNVWVLWTTQSVQYNANEITHQVFTKF